MRIIAPKTLRGFWANEPNAEQPLKSWYQIVSKVDWENHNQLKEQFGNASIINKKRVVFNIHGNRYRLIVDIEYSFKLVLIVWVGTHSDYDKIKVENVKYKKFD